MKNVALLSRFGALVVALLFLVAVLTDLRAQATTETAPARPPGLEELSQAELLRSYLQMRDQLHATQLAVVNNRVEAETAARAQVAAITEKLEAIKAVMATERERHQSETQRLQAERERQQLEEQRSIRTVLWAAAAFGGLGLLAMLIMPLFQWRAITRMAEVATSRPALPSPSSHAWVADENGGGTDQTVVRSNQRLTAVVERMEQRILELEHTAVPPLPIGSTSLPIGSDSARRSPVAVTDEPDLPRRNGHGTDHSPSIGAAPDHTARNGGAADHAAQITLLLAKARALATTNRAQEAVACYDEILKLDPNHPEALVKKGAALERLMRNEEAIRCYDRAIAVDEKMTLAYLYKGGVCNRLGRYDEALECYEQALQAQEAGK